VLALDYQHEREDVGADDPIRLLLRTSRDALGAGQAIQALAGHQDLSTTQRYMHLSPAALDAAIRVLEEPSPGPAKAGPHDECRGDTLEAAGNQHSIR